MQGLWGEVPKAQSILGQRVPGTPLLSPQTGWNGQRGGSLLLTLRAQWNTFLKNASSAPQGRVQLVAPEHTLRSPLASCWASRNVG